MNFFNVLDVFIFPLAHANNRWERRHPLRLTPCWRRDGSASLRLQLSLLLGTATLSSVLLPRNRRYRLWMSGLSVSGHPFGHYPGVLAYPLSEVRIMQISVDSVNMSFMPTVTEESVGFHSWFKILWYLGKDLWFHGLRKESLLSSSQLGDIFKW